VSIVFASYVIALVLLNAFGTLKIISGYNPTRTLFVGFLCATGVFLFLYKGFTPLENNLLNVAGTGAILVAFLPETDPRCFRADGGVRQIPGVNCEDFGISTLLGDQSWHGIAAIVFGLFGALAIFLCSHNTLSLKSMDNRPRSGLLALLGLIRHEVIGGRNLWLKFYWLMGITIAVSPVLALIVTSIAGTDDHKVFWIEAFGMVAFALYWWVKSEELKRSGEDKKLMGIPRSNQPPA
jgi:hypothetical protein